MKMTRKELLAIPKRKWEEEIEAKEVWIIPSGRKHDSGYACMDFVAKDLSGNLIGFGGICDILDFNGRNFQMDCEYPSRILHIWNKHPFIISAPDISSIYLIEK